nr:gustatory receptor 34 [Papilio glaucus]
MNILKPFKIIFVLGNVLFLFRNISFVGTRTRVIMILCILAEIFLSIYNCFIIGYYNLFIHLSDCINVYMVFGNSIILIILSCYNSSSFNRLLMSFNMNSSLFAKDNSYLKKMEKRNPLIIFVLILFVVAKIVFIVLSQTYNPLLKLEFSFFVSICLQMNAILCDVRYFYEYLLLYTLLGLICDQLDCIIRSIEKEMNDVTSNLNTIEMNVPFSVIKMESYEKNIEQWSRAYSSIANATDIFNDIFGGVYDTIALIMYGQNIVIMHLQIIVLSYTAQQIHNKVETVRRRLGKLLLDSVNNYNRRRATKDLLRFISRRRLRIQAFGSIPVDMSLPPSCVMLFTSYTVIALQFNNVL